MFEWLLGPTKPPEPLSVLIPSPDDRPNESATVRNKLTPAGAPLVSRFPSSPDVTSVWECFENAIKKHGADHRFIGTYATPDSYAWQTLGEVRERILDVGSGLVGLAGLGFGDRVGVYARNCPEWIITLFADAAYGLVTTTLYESFKAEDLPYMLNVTGMSALVCTHKNLANVLRAKPSCPDLRHAFVVEPDSVTDEERAEAARVGIKVASFADLEKYGKENRIPVRPGGAEDVYLICFTSGTTGTPKGAVLRHRNILSVAASGEIHFGEYLRSDGTYISYLPLAHSYEQANVLSCTNLGVGVGLYRGDPRLLFEDMQALKPLYFPSVPRVLIKFYQVVEESMKRAGPVAHYLYLAGLQYKKMLLARGINSRDTVFDRLVFNKIAAKLGGAVEIIITGSAPNSPEIVEWYRIVTGAEVAEGYGQTENSAGSILQPVRKYDYPHGNYIGVPYACNEIKLVDVPEMQYFARPPPGSGLPPRGEICIRGENVMLGYWKEDKKTKETIDEEGWLHTADVGQINPDGTVSVIDRAKNIFKLSQGEFVAVERLENVFISNRLIQQIYLHGDSHFPFLVAVVVPDPEVVAKVAKSAHPDLAGLDPEALLRHGKVKDIILADLREHGKSEGLHGFEIPKDLHIELEPFSVEAELITPTFKNRRPNLKKKYSDVCAALYRGHAQEMS